VELLEEVQVLQFVLRVVAPKVEIAGSTIRALQQILHQAEAEAEAKRVALVVTPAA
jgi:hypothetical protein